jgi:hypothetical protein
MKKRSKHSRDAPSPGSWFRNNEEVRIEKKTGPIPPGGCAMCHEPLERDRKMICWKCGHESEERIRNAKY